MAKNTARLMRTRRDSTVGLPPAARVDGVPGLVAAARETASGSFRRRLDSALTRVHQNRREYVDAVRVLAPLAASENEPRLWRWLADLDMLIDSGLMMSVERSRALRGSTSDVG